MSADAFGILLGGQPWFWVLRFIVVPVPVAAVFDAPLSEICRYRSRSAFPVTDTGEIDRLLGGVFLDRAVRNRIERRRLVDRRVKRERKLDFLC